MEMLKRAAAQAKVEYSLALLGSGQTSNGTPYPGGLDQTTPSLALQPGAFVAGVNFEVNQTGGYSRVQGYERYNGTALPSTATFTVVQVSGFTTVPTVGQIVQQASSGAQGTVAFVANPDAQGLTYLVLTQTTGAFDTSGALTTVISSYTVTAANPLTVTATSIPYPFVVPFSSGTLATAIPQTALINAQLSAQYQAAAADIIRAGIGPVPGSGNVLGVVGMTINSIDELFAFRANASGTATNIYKATGTGWQLVPLFNILTFTAGSSAGQTPADGGTLTQGATTATMMRIMWQSGSFMGGTAVGAIVVTGLVGPSFAAGLPATTSDGVTITIATANVPIVLTPGRKYEFDKGNFSGQLSTRRIYGVDATNNAFEFDGTTYAPITTGLVPDAPSHLTIHHEFLWLSDQSSLIYSAAGEPFKYSAVDGGGEIATGDTVNAMLTLPGSQTTATLGIWLQSNTAFLYGIDPASFNYVTFNTGQGALPYTAQNLFDSLVFDSLGVISLKTTLNYGNFLPSTLTHNILPFILQERTKVIASTLQRTKGQYRIFFSDGFGLWLTIVNQQHLGSAPVQFPNPVFVVDEVSLSAAGGNVNYFASNDGQGYVYLMDSGPSFDGANIEANIKLAWNALKSPRIEKTFHAASVEIASSSYAAISFGYLLGYGSPTISQTNPVALASNFSAAPMWDSGFTWDSGFIWDGTTLAPSDVDVTGTGENIQIAITSTTNYLQAFSLNSYIVHYTRRRGIRV